jgi:hypothetical protein
VDGWFCPNCKSLNRRGARRCYSCGGGAEGSDAGAGMPLQMKVPLKAIGTRMLGIDEPAPGRTRKLRIVQVLVIALAVAAVFAGAALALPGGPTIPGAAPTQVPAVATANPSSSTLRQGPHPAATASASRPPKPRSTR